MIYLKTLLETEYFGNEGSGVLILAKDTGKLLLFLRSESVNEPGTWNLVGGKMDDNENPKEAAMRELHEETGFDKVNSISHLYTFRHRDFKYHNYLVVVPFEFTPELNWEHDTSKWVEFGDWPNPLHFGLNDLLKHAGHKIKRVIDLIKKKKNNNKIVESFQKTSSDNGYIGIVRHDGSVEALYNEFSAYETDHSEIANVMHGKWRYFINSGILYWNEEEPSEEERHIMHNWLHKKGLSLKKEITSFNDLTEDMQSPPAQIQSAHEFSSEFINYIKSVENGGKVGFKHGKWFPHQSPEGGSPTIAYGHKVKSGEENKFSNGISDSAAERLLIDDLSRAKKQVYSDIKKMFDVQVPLDSRQEEMLTDYTYNLGTLTGFPKFVKAVLNKDWNTAKKEYIRSFKDASGERHTLARNKTFFNVFLRNL